MKNLAGHFPMYFFIQAEKGQIEMQKALESTKEALEARIDELMAEKEGAVTAIKTQFVESSKQSGKDKVN